MEELTSKRAAIEAINNHFGFNVEEEYGSAVQEVINSLPSAQSESTKTFIELLVEYPDPELCTYKEYKGKPYYSIKYIENGKTYVGYSTYNPEVLSQYLKEYFISSAQPEPEELDFVQPHKKIGVKLKVGQPEQKKGEWIHVRFMTEECSECHKQYHELKYGKFCPNCGADMRGKKDDID